MPSGLKGPEPNQLEGKEEIEDPVDLVETTEAKTRHRHSLGDRSNVPPTQEETQNLPYHPEALVPSKGAIRIATPMSGNKSKNKLSSMGPRPRSTLYATYGSKTSHKRRLNKLAVEFPSDQSRPRKQQKLISAMEPACIDTDDEVMIYPSTNIQQEPQKVSQSRNTSKYFTSSQDSLDVMDVDFKQQDSNKMRVTELSYRSAKSEATNRGDEGFVASIASLSVPTKGPASSTHGSNNPRRWSSHPQTSDGDLEHTVWKNPVKKKSSISSSRRKIDPPKTISLVCFQQGVKSYPTEGGPDSLFVLISPNNILKALYGEKGKEQEIWKIDPTDVRSIKCVYVNTPSRQFAIRMAQRQGWESDRTVVFTLEKHEDIEACKFNFFKRGLGNTPSEVEEKIFDNIINELKEWGDRQVIITEPESVVTHKHKTRQNIEESQEISHVEIPIRRSARHKVDKTKVTSSKRPRGSSTEDIEYPAREMRSSKPRLELPKPPWKNPLVYPPTGPRKEVIDYDDLKRLDSNSYLNDNIINFYLKYIEVQLQINSPEVAKETYFLNTFFYERLTKKDGKKKRDIDSVLKWTARVDIFKTSYVIIPINEATHWYLAIICNLCNLERKMNSHENKSTNLESNGTFVGSKKDGQDISLTKTLGSSDVTEPLMSTTRNGEEQDVEIVETQDNLEQMALDEESPIEGEKKTEINDREIIEVEDSSSQRSKPKGRAKLKPKNKSPPKKNRNAMPPDTPSIIILDSMGYGPTMHSGTIRNLREWLKVEAFKKRNIEIDTRDIHAAFGKAPNQNNWYDCGLFLLHYVELFFEHPVEFTSMFLEKGDRVSDQALWRKEKIKDMRKKLFHLFIQLHDDQEAALAEQKAPHRENQNWNVNRNTSQKVDEGNKPSQDLMEIDVEGLAKNNDLRNAPTAPRPTATRKDLGFEKFTGELEKFVTPDRCSREGTPTNLAVQVMDKLATQSINLEKVSNSILQPSREVTLPFRDSHDSEGVIT